MNYTLLEKLSRNFVENFVVNSMNGCMIEPTNIRMDERKGKNYIPLGINTRVIIIRSELLCLSSLPANLTNILSKGTETFFSPLKGM